jgi:hypothetical protein
LIAPNDTPQGKIALQFAEALVARNFVAAQAMLTHRFNEAVAVVVTDAGLIRSIEWGRP